MKLLLRLLFVLVPGCATAQYAGINFTNIGLSNGLSQSSVVDIAFDAKGFAWFATQDGLNRYDGRDFQVIDEKFDDITTGNYSRLGKLATASNEQFFMITKGGQLERLNLINNHTDSINIPGEAVPSLFTCLMPGGLDSLWAGTSTGKLLCYNSSAGRVSRSFQLPAGSTINQLFRDRQGITWVIGNGIWRLDRSKLVSEPISGWKTSPAFSVLTQDSHGRLWAGSLGAGLFVKETGGSFKPCHQFLLPMDLVIEDLLADRDGLLWIGTYGQGLFIVDPGKGTVRHLLSDKKNPYSIGFNDVLSIRQDREQGIWIGTDGGGVSYYNKRANQFQLYSPVNTPPEISIGVVRSIATSPTDGGIWAGTSDDGLTRIDRRNGTYRTWHFQAWRESLYNPDRILSLFIDDDGFAWTGTQGNGIQILDTALGGTFKWYHPEAAGKLNIPDGTSWCFYRASATAAWTGTEQGGLCLLDRNKGLLGQYRPSPAGMDGGGVTDAIRCITPMDDSTLIIGFLHEGVRLFHINTRTFSEFRSDALERFFFHQQTAVKSLYFHASVLWIGTDGEGLLSYHTGTGKLSVAKRENGLPNNTIYGILPDGAGYLWISTNQGLSRFREDLDFNGAPTQFTNYTAAQGLQSNEFNTGAAHRAADGSLLFGGINGLNVFNPQNFLRADQPIPVVFTRFMIDNDEKRGDTTAAYRTRIELAYQDHSLGISFAALDFSPVHQYRYYYRLAGYEKHWVDAGLRNYAAYTNIPPGDYVFMVKYAKDPDNPGDPVSAVHVIVHGPFWKNAWFIGLMIALLIAAVYGIYRYRIAQVVKLLQVRQHVAADLHDDIGSTLSNINILSELSRKSLQNPVQATGFLDRISEEVNTSSQSLDDIIWSINTHNDTWEETFSRMRRYAAEVFENSGTAYNVNLAEQGGRVKINMEKRRDLFLIYKEILNNIHKHADASEVQIDMQFLDNRLLMRISDNGTGFDQLAQTHRNGIRNLRRRVARWKGTMELESDGGGTRLNILL